MTIATAAPSLERYRTTHKIEPVPGLDGRQRCATDAIPVYRVLTQRWQHDMNVVRRLIRDELASLVYEPCFFCGETKLVAVGCYSRVTLGTGVVNLCDNCREKGTESDG